MSPQDAEKAITISALIVAAVYVYRRMTEPAGKPTGSRLAQLSGKGAPPPYGVFITAWGFTFLVVSIIAAAAPGLGGSMAILIATGDLLGNSAQVAKDINKKVAAPPTSTGKTKS